MLIMLIPGNRNQFTECQIAGVQIELLSIMDVKSRWNSKWKFCSVRQPIMTIYPQVVQEFKLWRLLASLQKTG